MSRLSFQATLSFLCLAATTGWAWTSANDSVCTRRVLDLSGQWRFQLDHGDVGEQQGWFRSRLPRAIRLPGSLQEQGYGDDISVETRWTGTIVDKSWYDSPRYAPYREPGNIKVPFWLQPEKHYVGPAWYERTVRIPAGWAGKRIVLFLERPHWETTVWWDGRKAGTENALGTPHEYVLSESAEPGEHILTIRVDNRIKQVDVGINSHSISDQTQSNWNGIAGLIELLATDPIWVDRVDVFPEQVSKHVRFQVRLGNATGSRAKAKLTIELQPPPDGSAAGPIRVSRICQLDSASTAIEFDCGLGPQPSLWDEFRPNLYRAMVRVESVGAGKAYRDEVSVTFGVRQIDQRGRQFVLNGRSIFLRGTVECCVFPLTGYPPTDKDYWRKIIGQCKAFGLNHMRFHSWCPPEAAFAVADELGFYFHVECSSWANTSSSVGDSRPVDKWLYEEAERMIRYFGNHPSFMFMAYGNEPAGPERGARYLRQWVEHFRQRDPRRLYTGAAGWPMIEENQYHVTPQPRIHHWGSGLRDRLNAKRPETCTDYRDFVLKSNVPVVAHEAGQWCVYPNFEEIKKYRGVSKPKNFEIFRDFLVQNHMGDQARQFLMASGKLQVLCYKEEVESALRTPEFGGFQLLQLNDFTGQGTALVGVLDPFWDEKPYVTAAEWRRFCAPVVPLARLPKRVFLLGERLVAEIDLYQFWRGPLPEARLCWKLLDSEGKVLRAGRSEPRTFAAGQLHRVGTIAVPLRDLHAPQQMKLVIGVEGTNWENDWDLWVYPPSVPTEPSQEVLVCSEVDKRAERWLAAGGKLLLLIPPKRVKTAARTGFTTVFWNTAWTRNQPPHTLGILCDSRHPALRQFPTDCHTNWQWWELIHEAAAMQLDGFPPALRPIVQVIDTWFEARRLALMFEARVGGGKLLACSIDLQHDLSGRPVARQLRYSLLRYIESDAFAPSVLVEPELIRSLFRPPSVLQRLGATVRADSAQPGYPPAHLLDGEPNTIWHTPWGSGQPGYPHHLILDLKGRYKVAGLVYLPRQDMSNGRMSRWAVYVSDDGRSCRGPLASSQWLNEAAEKRVSFDRPVLCRYVKLVALSEVRGRPWASAAELDLLLAE